MPAANPNSLAAETAAAPLPVRLRGYARTLRNRWVNQELKKLETVRRQLRRGEVDVLVFGDSSFTTASPRDTDFTMIPELIGQRLDGARVAGVASPGLSGFLYSEMLRVLGTLDQRPQAVVFTVTIRTNTMVHIRHHPRYRYAATHAALARIDSARRPIRYLGQGDSPTPEDYQRFTSLPVRSRWSGVTTIGDFRTRLKGMGRPPWPEELERGLFDYFHGEIVEPDDKDLPQLGILGTRLREYGVPAVGYWTIPPLHRGELWYPGEFTDHVRSNWALVRSALLAPGGDVSVVEPELEDLDFEDSQNANEHYSFSGRSKIADLVAGALHESTR